MTGFYMKCNTGLKWVKITILCLLGTCMYYVNLLSDIDGKSANALLRKGAISGI